MIYLYDNSFYAVIVISSSTIVHVSRNSRQIRDIRWLILGVRSGGVREGWKGFVM